MTTDLSSPDVHVRIDGGIATVTIDRQERMNALHPAAHHALQRIFDTLEADEQIRCVVLTGAGTKAFCSGYDLRDNLETGAMDIGDRGFGGLTKRIDYRVPLIAAVNGVAMGGGFEMALACDFIIASSNAKFALPEPKVGWAALSGGVQRLPRAIGIKRAMDIILTGRTVGAEEAFALGLVSEVVAPDELQAAARRWAGQIVACAPLAIRCSKRLAYAGLDQPHPGAALDVEEDEHVKAMLLSEDATEGKRAFVEKRSPVWKGR